MFSLAKLYKNLSISLFIGLAALVAIPNFASADTYVNGYYRKDGTYVKPHYRSDPDGNVWNNWSTKGNTNPYTGEPGTKDPYSSSPSYNYSLPKSTPYESPTYNYPSYDYSSPSYTAPSYESPSYKYTAPTPYQFNVNNRTKPTPTPYRFNSSFDDDNESYFDSYYSDDEDYDYDYGDYSEEGYSDYYEEDPIDEDDNFGTASLLETDTTTGNSSSNTLSPSVAGAVTSSETNTSEDSVLYSVLGLVLVGGGVYAYRKRKPQ